MNVIVSNKYKDLLNSLDFEISQNINGEFSVDELIQRFSNFYFNKMFLDITAIQDYKDLKNIQKLSMNLDMSRIILILDDDPFCSSPYFFSQLISMGIYNFTRNKDGIIYLYNHPNIYRDVAHLHNVGNTAPTSSGGYQPSMIQPQHVSLEGTVVLGIKNLTSHAGATTLTYMLKKVLSQYYSVVAIEVNKRDFMFFKDTTDMISTNSGDLSRVISENASRGMIIVDLNETECNLCTDMIYLIEPSIIKMNRLTMIDRNIFSKLGNKKVVLNKSLLQKSDIFEFEREAGINVFYNMPPINDRLDYSQSILPLIYKLGLIQKD